MWEINEVKGGVGAGCELEAEVSLLLDHACALALLDVPDLEAEFAEQGRVECMACYRGEEHLVLGRPAHFTQEEACLETGESLQGYGSLVIPLDDVALSVVQLAVLVDNIAEC